MNPPSTQSAREAFQIVKIELPGVIVIAAYRPPSNTSSDEKTQFISLLSDVQPSSKPAVVCGDMNIAFEPSKPCSNQLSDKMNRKRFKQVVTYPTHIKGNILDHMYVRCPVQPLWKLHYPYYSDHDAIMLILRKGKQASQNSP